MIGDEVRDLELRLGRMRLELFAARADLEARTAELAERRKETARLEVELEDTNRGVVALYAELEEQAQRLREADATKSRFLSNVSHEFRTPLNSIHALSTLLLERADGELTPEQEKQVTFIRRAAADLRTLVDDLLDLAKIESGRLEVHPAPFQVETLLRSVQGTLRPLVVNDDVRLVVDEAVDLPALDTDEGKLSQILRNLVSNALKFTERGEVRLTASAGSAGEVVFRVADTGIGIADADRDRIFDEFVQVESRLQSRVRGTGLGLPVSRRLAELLGGSIEVRSSVGHGSVFTVRIPVAHPSLRASADVGAAGATSSSAAYSPAVGKAGDASAGEERWTVLIVDDDPAARYVTRGLLRGAGCAFVEAGGGIEGLEMARRLTPDLVVLDLQMPDLGGTEVLRALRADPATRPIPVVINTSRMLEGAERHELEGLASAILGKGDAPPDARDVLLRALGRADTSSPALAGASTADDAAAPEDRDRTRV